MIVPFLLWLISAFGLGIALRLPGLQDLIMLAGPMFLASLWLFLRAWLGQSATQRLAERRRLRKSLGQTSPARRGLFPRAKPKYMVIDGSNVMHWKDGVPQIEVVQAVVAKLTKAGYAPGVVFDANAGYKLMGRYRHDHAFGKLLGLPQDRVMVVDKGTPADPVILASAKALGGRIVSNDRFRDWAVAHPEVAQPGHVIGGGFRDGQVWLDMA